MKTEDIFKLLNQGKRDVYDIKKPKKYTFKSVLYSFTGKTIKKVTEFVTDALKHDLTIEFKPVLPFRRKDLKGVDVTTLKNEGGTHTLQDKEDLSTIDKSSGGLANLPKVQKEDEFVNWFDIDSVSKPKEPKEQRVVSLRKSDGRIVPLDDYWLKD